MFALNRSGTDHAKTILSHLGWDAIAHENMG